MGSVQKKSINAVGFFYPLFNKNYRSLIKDADLVHPKFSAVWKPLMESFGDRFTTQQIMDCCENEFYANYFVAKVDLVKQLCKFTKDVHKRLDTLLSIQENLWSDSTYITCGSDDTQLKSIFNRTYYTYHPFILERVTPFFFDAINASVQRAQRIAQSLKLRLRYRYSSRDKAN